MLISATDVAMIARVQRPVVSMWRKRYSGPDAFPGAVGGRFEAEAVVGWLVEHGRGNNPHPERALPMLGMLVEARTDQSRAMGLSAMLACRAAYGEGLVEDLGSGAVTASVMAGLDRFGSFGDEVAALGGDLPRTAAAVDAFLDERFGAADAMRWFTDDCLVRHLPLFAAAALSDGAAGLVARAAEALADLSPRPGICSMPPARASPGCSASRRSGPPRSGSAPTSRRWAGTPVVSCRWGSGTRTWLLTSGDGRLPSMRPSTPSPRNCSRVPRWATTRSCGWCSAPPGFSPIRPVTWPPATTSSATAWSGRSSSCRPAAGRRIPARRWRSGWSRSVTSCRSRLIARSSRTSPVWISRRS